ncbi:hypothetical protein UFOVP1619_31 [uncultured Caudovirales phage]|uniref:Uncharacterized protein n=1 Tax=uncultured Caudovirales phage TaxID=2100421 RepID=A0A6J5SW32_9CAUD|nr:hypothetical protein UFOVP1619_31 [uncultured Caudovirales phage]
MTNQERAAFEAASAAHDLADKIAERLTLHTAVRDWSPEARAADNAARATLAAKIAAADALNRASNPRRVAA